MEFCRREGRRYMTERLYYHDSFLREFDAKVLACEPAGARFRVVLDRTAFYPASGGQPHDTGRLGDAAVREVADTGDDALAHITDRAVPLAPVHGAIDWERRFDHMQQHTGQHILSAAFVSLFKFPTVSFHLGVESSTIDLDARQLVQRHVEEAERLANQIVFDDRAVTVRFGTAQELAEAGIRKAVDREGTLRAIEIEGCDRQPCGGTHVGRTGQVGAILLRKVETQKQFWRVEFVCGYRAMRVSRTEFTVLGEAARVFSCGLPDVPGMAQKSKDGLHAAQRHARKLSEQLAELEARAMLAAEPATAEGRALAHRLRPVIVRVFDDADAEFLRILAAKLVSQPGVQVLLGTRAGGHVVFAQSPGGAGDIGALLRESLAAAGGKGGGPRDFAQGRVPDPTALDLLLARAAEKLNA
jgi:alanyl-tRNA synthetase